MTKQKQMANISLLIMGTGFVSSVPFVHNMLGYFLQSGFEAGVVGGLADWFAVTALFRHPMGVPIPHTALLPKNREKITSSFVSVVENEWLTKESIVERVKQIGLAEKIITELEKGLRSETSKKIITEASQSLIKNLPVDQLSSLIYAELKELLSAKNVEVLVRRVLEQVIEQDYDQKGFDFILDKVENWLVRSEARAKLGSFAHQAISNIKVDGFMQFAISSFTSMISEEKLGDLLQRFLLQNLVDMRDPHNTNRQTIVAAIRNELMKLRENRQVIEQLTAWIERFLSDWKLEDLLKSKIEQLQERALQFVGDSNFMDAYAVPVLSKVINQVKEDATRMEQLNQTLESFITRYVEKNHAKIGELIKSNLDKMDDESLIRMTEDKVGKDLQWIRVNGAICGFLIGLILAGLKLAF
ncbi:DUF445 domain-containing protein [Brevibacillus ginsengisoli]|uniref:DUF445 domain-containing protein n=1 Tax=Brevibacillus ginsengisoli TaxID=363854 RepID=UPI003CE822FD